jgi:two-component system response regulator AtoC
MKHDWPGNVRELENTLTRASLMAKSLVMSEVDIAAAFDGIHYLPTKERSVQTLAEVERDHISSALDSYDWNLGNTCQALGITRPTLRAKIKMYELKQRNRT